MTPSVLKAGLSDASFSKEVSLRIPSSLVITSSVPETVAIQVRGPLSGVDTASQPLEVLLDLSDARPGLQTFAIGEDEIVCDARVEVNAVNIALGTEIPNHRTVAGLLLDELEHIPAKGTELIAHEVRFTVEDATDRAVLSVRVQRLPPESGDEPHLEKI